MPSKSKPIQLVLAEGNKRHLTKKEIEHREKIEKSLYTGEELEPNEKVQADTFALAKFNKLKYLYSKMKSQYVDGLDSEMVNQYCLLLSEIDMLQNMIKRALDENDISLYVTLDNKLIKKTELSIKLEDRLFLNPAARIKAIPKTPPEETEVDPMQAYLR